MRGRGTANLLPMQLERSILLRFLGEFNRVDHLTPPVGIRPAHVISSP